MVKVKKITIFCNISLHDKSHLTEMKKSIVNTLALQPGDGVVYCTYEERDIKITETTTN